MKRWYLYILVLLFIVVVISVHIYKIETLVTDIEALSDRAVAEYEKENWDGVSSYLKEIEDIWMKNRLWACSTISTKEIDEIEISLQQSIEYAKISSRENFAGEFSMFRLCIEHIPMQEGLSLHELL